LPALMAAEGPSNVTIEGGTHNIAAPPFDFLQRTFAPALRRIGPSVTLALDRYGFYPAGGGRFTAAIVPSPLRTIALDERGEIHSRRVVAVVANLPRHIA